MKKKVILIIVTGIFAFSTNAVAQEHTKYFGINISGLQYTEDGSSEEFNPIVLFGTFGYFFHKNFGIEGRLGAGIASDKINRNGYDMTYKVDHIVGVYGKGIFEIHNNLFVYGMIGGIQTERSVKVQELIYSDKDKDLSYGGGVEYEISNQFYIDLEYMSYLSKSYYDLQAISIGIKKYF